MPPQKGALADAWDDDWETIADKEETKPDLKQPEPKLTKAQLKAKHVELNRQIWESADNPETQWYPEAQNTAPVQAPFKPKVTMLARKPAPQILSRNTGAEDDDDSEDERRKQAAADFEERKVRAQRERAEKERKYAEARERIFGSPAASATEDSRSNSPSKPNRGKGKARGGRDSQPRSSNEQSPARGAPPVSASRQLYDPTYIPKPGSTYVQKREGSGSRPHTPSGQEKPLRQPQGPARGGGRGFAARGAHNGSIGPSS